ncbi:MAG: hypothetical protein KC776_28385 [Myxococcales bacterium]|nr:hypothetical protein [Myxococcales bacterium]
MRGGGGAGRAVTALALVLAGCGGKSTLDTDGAPHMNPQPEVPGGVYTLDFTGTVGGGFEVSAWQHVAFSVDLAHHLRSYALPNTGYEATAPGVYAAPFTYADCNAQHTQMLDHVEYPDSDLPATDSAHVATLSVEMLPSQYESNLGQGEVCFGYRDVGGTWHWKFEPTDVTWDAAAERFRAEFSTNVDSTTGLALFYDAYDSQGRKITKIQYTAQQ